MLDLLLQAAILSAFMKEHSISMIPVTSRKSLSYTVRALCFFASSDCVKNSLEDENMQLLILLIPVMLNRAVFHRTENVMLVVQCLSVCSPKQSSLITQAGW